LLQYRNIIHIYDSYSTFSDEFYIILKSVNGKNLQKYIDTHDLISEKQVLRIFTQIILSFEYIHSQNILYNNIKIVNVILLKNNVIKHDDFWFSKRFSK
jgi:serine/threonine protein kinase